MQIDACHCEKYDPHCLSCVVGEPDASLEATVVWPNGKVVEFGVTFSDGTTAGLWWHESGWQIAESYRTDCATATGMYD